MINEGEKFYIYRVYNANEQLEGAYVKEIHDPIERWKNDEIIAYPFKLKI